MPQIFSLRERLAALPGTVKRRAETSGHHASVVADARAIAPEIPRDADRGHLERAARRLLRRAARDEFAREGVTRIPLPSDGVGRAELRRADIPGSSEFHAVVEDVLSAVDIAPSALERDDALALLEEPGSADAYGLSPEVASDLAAYLLGRAYELGGGGAGEVAAGGAGVAGGAGGAGGRGADGAESGLEAYLAAQEHRIREDMRAALVRLVRVPLELQVARERHARISHGGDDPAGVRGAADGQGGEGADGADLGRRAREAFEFAQSEAGKAAFRGLRSGAGRAAGRVYEKYTHPRTPPRS